MEYNTVADLYHHPWAIIERKLDNVQKRGEDHGYTAPFYFVVDICLVFHYAIWYRKERNDYYKQIERLQNLGSSYKKSN
jgi:hypothetical protein